jgi:hypothetical protein
MPRVTHISVVVLAPGRQDRGRDLTLRRLASCAALIALLFLTGWLSADEAQFRLTFGNQSSRSEVAFMTVLPGEQVPLRASGKASTAYIVRAAGGELTPSGRNRWRWRAPRDPGVYAIEVMDASPVARGGTSAGRDEIRLNAFVMVPASRAKGGRLNGFRIGEYPRGIFRDNPIYRAPRGYIEITRGTEDVKVSPRFEIGQFLCKQPDPFPKYLVLDERLPIALETIVDRLNALGHDMKALTVMSGYRTPFYNAAIGNVKFSLHQFGGAADVFVDEDKNGTMDDLNRDRRIDRQDAVFLHDIIDDLMKQPSFPFQGGLGHYAATKSHGPFVHVDVRGNRARWGG